jgi:hypothetical protein
MKKNKITIMDATRGSNINNNTQTHNTKTHNIEHITLNTTSATKSTGKKLLDETSSLPVAEEKKTVVGAPDLATLEAEVVQNRQQREQAHRDKPSVQKFVDENAKLRKKIQFAKERDAKTMIYASNIYRIEVSMHVNSTDSQIKLNIDVLLEAGGLFAKYAATCQNSRARDIAQSIPPKHRDWQGYEYAKDCIRDGLHAGKMRLRQTAANKVKIAPKVIPRTAVIFDLPNLTATLLINDQVIPIQLAHYNKEFYCAKGIITTAEEVMDI